MMRKKKYLAVIALLLVAAMVSTATLAYAPHNGKSSVQSEQPGGKKTQKENAKQNENKGGTKGQEKSNQGSPKKPDQGSKKQGKPDNRKDSLDIEEIRASIAAVTDVATQSSLTALLNAYETALANEESGRTGGADKQTMKALADAAEAAENALVKALSDAGIADDEENKSNGVGKGPQGPKHLDLTTIEASIAKLNNPELQASLTALVTAYKTALANEQSGIANGLDEATIAAYRKAVEDAKAAVLKALTGAGIRDSETATPSSLPKGQQKKLLDINAITASITTVTDAQTQASLTTLTETYKAAVANMENAWATGDDATKEATREAVNAAEKALIEALNGAGISTAETPNSVQKPPQEQRVTGIWVAVVNWFSNLFGKLTK